MFIMHFRRQLINREINYISIFYEILHIIMKIVLIITPTSFFMTLPQNTLICKLDLVYRYIVYNEKHVYGHFTHILQK